jgi:hypothetical protein
MRKVVGIFCICLTAFPAFSKSATKWQVGTVTEVKIHQPAEKVGGSKVSLSWRTVTAQVS